MTVYVGRDVQIKIQMPVEREEETMKLINNMVYIGEAGTQGLHRAYKQEGSSEPAPDDSGWTELTDSEYNQIARSDDTRFSLATSTNGNYAMLMLRYKCMFPEADVKKICSRFEGYGVRGSDHGVTIKIWNHTTDAWENETVGTGSGDEWVDLKVLSNCPDYIDDDGYIWILIRTTHTDDGTNHAVLYCDCARGFVTKDRFIVDHKPISDLDMDGVADEIEHVKVYRNDSLITPISVDDSEGLVVLADGDFEEDDYFYCSYRYDSEPYIAQELTLEPKQHIEGIDGLGSDTIQVWAPLLKEIDGSIKQVLKPGEEMQIRSIEPFRSLGHYYRNPCESSDDWDYTGWAFYENRFIRHVVGGGHYALIKNAPPRGNRFIILGKFTQENPPGWGRIGLTFNHSDPSHNYEFAIAALSGLEYLKNGATIKHWSKSIIRGEAIWLKVEMEDGKMTFYWDQGKGEWEKLGSATDLDNPPGKIGFFANGLAFADNLIYNSLSGAELGYGIIVSWSRNDQTVKLGLDGVVFPEGSIPAPKNEPIYIITPFKARSIKVIT